MSTNGVGTQLQSAPMTSRRRSLVTTGLALRILIAFVISWLIVLAFFISGAVSH